MTKRTYGENERTTVERPIEDEKVLEAFADELGAEESAEKLLEDFEGSESFTAIAEYSLVHPYDGENFSTYLMHNEEVTASVELYIEASEGWTEVYGGEITYDAVDIFSPEEVVDVHREENLDGVQEVSSKKAPVERPESSVELAETD